MEVPVAGPVAMKPEPVYYMVEQLSNEIYHPARVGPGPMNGSGSKDISRVRSFSTGPEQNVKDE